MWKDALNIYQILTGALESRLLAARNVTDDQKCTCLTVLATTMVDVYCHRGHITHIAARNFVNEEQAISMVLFTGNIQIGETCVALMLWY